MNAAPTVLLANPRGFCAGVDRAIEIVERALEHFGAPIYVRHEIVHNRHVVESLRARGAVFVEELDEVPDGAVVVFSAHGVAQGVHERARARGLTVLDATCPLVTKVHHEVQRLHRQGYDIVMIGHRGHPEVEGTMGQVPDRIHLVETEEDVTRLTLDPERCAYVTQTTLSVDDARRLIERLTARYPHILGPKKDDICYATQNRQDAVKRLAAQCDLVLVIGSPNSSNSNRLREVAAALGVPAHLIEDETALTAETIRNARRIGLTAGASAPEALVQRVLARLRELGAAEIAELPGVAENVRFTLPKTLTEAT